MRFGRRRKQCSGCSMTRSGRSSTDTLARLLSFNNVILTSHQGFFTKEALHNIAEVTLHNIRDFLEGKPLANRVSLQSH